MLPTLSRIVMCQPRLLCRCVCATSSWCVRVCVCVDRLIPEVFVTVSVTSWFVKVCVCVAVCFSVFLGACECCDVLSDCLKWCLLSQHSPPQVMSLQLRSRCHTCCQEMLSVAELLEEKTPRLTALGGKCLLHPYITLKVSVSQQCRFFCCTAVP